jgi:hypothetical protein
MYFSSLLFVNRLLLLKVWKIGYRFSKIVVENFVGPWVQWEDHSLPKGRKSWTTLTYMTIPTASQPRRDQSKLFYQPDTNQRI